MNFLVLLFLAVRSACECVVPPSSTGGAAAFAKQPFDFIVVGGGTAGLTVANRLTENPRLRVGIIEAGFLHLDDPLVDVPGLSGLVGGNPDYDWAFQTTPQVHAAGQTIATPRGKLVGGSSGINLMGWDRGSKPEYDAWARFFPGSEGWNWDSLLPYLKKIEKTALQPTDPFPGISGQTVDPRVSGFNGPIDTTLNSVYMDDVDPYVRAWNAINVSTVANPYSGSKNGVYNIRLAVDGATETRSYAATGYYCPASKRPNLFMITRAQVTKVLLTQAGGLFNASGVTFTVSGTSFTATAKQGVILSAGAVQTPQLLELSGIGGKQLLSSLGIKTLVDLPGVGENLQDHIFTPSQFQLTPGITTFDKLRNDPAFAALQSAEYNKSRTGFLTASDSAVTFIPLQSFLGRDTIKSMISAAKAAFANTSLTPLQKIQYGIQFDWLSSGLVPQTEFILFSKGFVVQPNASYFSVLSGIQHPFSRGSVHINTTNPLAPPVIDPNYLGQAIDLQILGQATELTGVLAQTMPLKDLVTGKQLPPADIVTTEDFQSYARGSLGSGSHLIGTAAMAQRSIGGVVDASLKVYGTHNLRVVDASIMPMEVAAHLQATAYAIGEKAADMILKEHR